MARLVLEFLSAREASPVALIGLAARNAVPLVSIGLVPFRQLAGAALAFGALPDWDLIGDTPNRRELKHRAEAEGVGIDSADVFLIRPDADLEAFRPALESAAWLGAGRVTVLPFDDEPARMIDRMRQFCDIAADYGLRPMTEHSPRMALKTIRQAVAFHARVAHPALDLVIDALHMFRGDNQIADLATIDPAILGRVQLCDGPAEMPAEGGGYEAFYERMIPGDGAFPLAAFIAAIPPAVNFGLEVPLWALQQAGVEPGERVRRIVAAARRLLGDRVS